MALAISSIAHLLLVSLLSLMSQEVKDYPKRGWIGYFGPFYKEWKYLEDYDAVKLFDENTFHKLQTSAATDKLNKNA